MQLSCCLIVKNEENNLGSFMEHLKSVVDEWIVVDTGSTDNTIQIAESFGAKVFHYNWNDDFAAARNVGLKNSTSAWILQLDPDERLSEAGIEKLKQLTAGPANKIFILPARNYISGFANSGFNPCKGEYPEFEKGSSGYFCSERARLFPNDQDITYRGAIHEQISGSQYPEERVNDLIVHHFNPIASSLRPRDKRTLYIACAQKKVKDEPQNWRAHYELGVELSHAVRWSEAVDAFKKSIEVNPTGNVMTYIGLSCALTELNRTAEAQDTLFEALQKFPVHPDVILNLGVSLYRDKNWHDALESFQQLCKRYPDSSMGFYYAGLTLEKLKVYDGAKACFTQSLQLFPDFQKAKEAKARVESSQKG